MLGRDVRVVDGFVFDAGEDLQGFAFAVMGEEPSTSGIERLSVSQRDLRLENDQPGGLGEPRDRCVEEKDKDKLERDGKAPCDSARVKGEPVVDPIHQTVSTHVQPHLQDDQLAAPSGLRRLRLPDGGCRGVDAVAHPVAR